MRIVVKVGTSTLTHTSGRINIRRTEKLCKILSDVKNAGHELILVSSGAIGMGVGKLNMKSKPEDMPTKQAAAAIGQCELMYLYDKLFREYNHIVAQMLITGLDFSNEESHKNFQSTLNRLLELNVIPIINENDTIATQEISVGDNDTMGAIVAENANADLLIILSDIDGLYTGDPRNNPDAQLIDTVFSITPEIKELAGTKGTTLGTGGMITKIHAAEIAMNAGIDMIIANGTKPELLYNIIDGEKVGTVTAKNAINSADTETKNKALANMADALLAHTDAILEANKQDVEAARGKISDVMIDRLMLDAGRIEGMAKGIRELIDLDDPAGKVLRTVERPNGIVIEKTAVPMGVIAIIYESRPNVTSDAAALCIKSGNVCVLRSGKEAWKSANAVVTALKEGMVKSNLPGEGIQLIEDTSRESSVELMKAVGYVDLLIPRGGPGLIRSCVENAKVPCIQTGTGICHVYVDESADFEKALQIIENAKTSRPSVCNAEEVLLVHSAVAEKFLPLLQKKLVEERKEKGEIPVELRLCDRAAKIISGTLAGADDFDTEFLDYILAVKIVDSVEEAVEHISKHSTGHSEAIITESKEAADYFTMRVDSAAVYVNVSTRFTDGGEFGLGCEMGISTQKLHARGPMGLEELCTYKYIIRGEGQIR